jgi:hypothetical protein
MPKLIVRDQQGKDIFTRPAESQEYLVYGRALMVGEMVTFEGKRYKLHTVARTVPEEDCVLGVTFDSNEQLACGCTMGYCTCC